MSKIKSSKITGEQLQIISQMLDYMRNQEQFRMPIFISGIDVYVEFVEKGKNGIQLNFLAEPFYLSIVITNIFEDNNKMMDAISNVILFIQDHVKIIE